MFLSVNITDFRHQYDFAISSNSVNNRFPPKIKILCPHAFIKETDAAWTQILFCEQGYIVLPPIQAEQSAI